MYIHKYICIYLYIHICIINIVYNQPNIPAAVAAPAAVAPAAAAGK